MARTEPRRFNYWLASANSVWWNVVASAIWLAVLPCVGALTRPPWQYTAGVCLAVFMGWAGAELWRRATASATAAVVEWETRPTCVKVWFVSATAGHGGLVVRLRLANTGPLPWTLRDAAIEVAAFRGLIQIQSSLTLRGGPRDVPPHNVVDIELAGPAPKYPDDVASWEPLFLGEDPMMGPFARAAGWLDLQRTDNDPPVVIPYTVGVTRMEPE